jgi:hypothetical protein
MLVKAIRERQSDGRELGLTLGRVYEVLGIEADDYRLLSDENHLRWPNDPILYEPLCFQVVDAAEPGFWLGKLGEGGERYAYPASWSRVGFFEDYHDRVQAVRDQFWVELREFYPRTWEKRRGAS